MVSVLKKLGLIMGDPELRVNELVDGLNNYFPQNLADELVIKELCEDSFEERVFTASTLEDGFATEELDESSFEERVLAHSVVEGGSRQIIRKDYLETLTALPVCFGYPNLLVTDKIISKEGGAKIAFGVMRGSKVVSCLGSSFISDGLYDTHNLVAYAWSKQFNWDALEECLVKDRSFEELVSVSAHELGHALGLNHHPYCIMHFNMNPIFSKNRFCPECVDYLKGFNDSFFKYS